MMKASIDTYSGICPLDQTSLTLWTVELFLVYNNAS